MDLAINGIMNNNNIEIAGIRHFGAGLRIKNAPELHDEISKILKPTHVHKKGEKKFKEKVWDNDIWILDSPLSDEKDLIEHILWIWEQIKPHIEYFMDLKKKGVEMDLFCSFTTDSDQDGFTLDARTNEFINKLQLNIEFSIIFL